MLQRDRKRHSWVWFCSLKVATQFVRDASQCGALGTPSEPAGDGAEQAPVNQSILPLQTSFHFSCPAWLSPGISPSPLPFDAAGCFHKSRTM